MSIQHVTDGISRKGVMGGVALVLLILILVAGAQKQKTTNSELVESDKTTAMLAPEETPPSATDPTSAPTPSNTDKESTSIVTSSESPQSEHTYKAYTAGVHTFTTSFSGSDRSYLVQLPKEYRPNDKQYPIVVVMHGSAGNKSNMVDELGDTVGRNEYLALYPEGMQIGNLENHRLWDRDRDVPYVVHVLKEVQQRFAINPKRIYATGMSAGAAMSHFLACDHAELVAAIAPVGAHYGDLSQRKCSPSSPVAVLQFSATNDEFVPYNGGQAGKCSVTGSMVFNSVEDSTKMWVKKNECAQDPRRTYTKGTVVCDTYERCTNGADVTLCTIKADPKNNNLGGHSWPGSKNSAAWWGMQLLFPNCPVTPTQDISANEEMMKFFNAHPKK